MNICIFPKNSFCSSTWRTEFSQYFHIYVVLFLGNSLRLCCNISYTLFSVSRFVLSGTSNENKLRKFIEKQNIKRFYFILFWITLGFSVFLLFENYVNKLFEEFDVTFMNSIYDVRYCQSSFNEKDLKKFILTSGFNIKCEIFKWLNIINNILNNVLFLFISIFIDILMIRYSNKVIKEKMSIKCPHIADAIQEQAKQNDNHKWNIVLLFTHTRIRCISCGLFSQDARLC